MQASFVDLRKKSGDIIRALQRNESVTVLYRGKPAAVMHPIGHGNGSAEMQASEHPAFGLWADRDDLADPAAFVREVRKGRFDAL